MSANDFPPEEIVKTIVEEELPAGIRLKRISFTFDALEKGLPEGFIVVIELEENEDARRFGTPGLGYAITQRIRTRWSRDDLFVKITSSHEDPE